MQQRGLIGRGGVVAVLVLAALLLGAAAGENSPGNDPLLDRQYHLRKVRVVDAWDEVRGYGQVIAVLDTGVDLQHPDLRRRFVQGVDLVDRGTPPDDDNGHGTFVAGIAAANLNNKRGGSGAAPRALIMPVRVLDKEGEGTSDVVAEGIRWATREGADVINLSLADVPGQKKSATALITTDVELAIRQAAVRGIVVVLAAGNEGEDSTPYSQDLPALIVGATTPRDGVWEHSNYDDRTLFAPGVDIISTYIGEPYAQADGTSFSAPIVSAGAALLLQDGRDAEQTRRRLRDTARPIGEGVGRVDIAAALGIAPRVRTTPKPTPSPEPREPGDESEKPNKPEPITKPSPIKPRPVRKPPRERPVPIVSPIAEPTETEREVAAAGPEKKRRRNRPAAPAASPSPPAGIAAPAADDGAGPWPFVLAGGALFVVVVGVGGYLASRRAG